MLAQTFATLQRELANDSDASIDAAKSVVECACQILVRELDAPENPIAGWPDSPLKTQSPGLTHWVSAALALLGLRCQRDDAFRKVVAQINHLATELNNFRNVAGNVSHGREGFAAKLSMHHRRSAVLAADAIVTFLHTAYLEREPDPVGSLEPFERFSTSSELIDAAARVKSATIERDGLALVIEIGQDEVIALSIKPSELLFGVDRQAYKLARNIARELPNATGEAGSQDDGAVESAPPADLAVGIS